ncbi:MAG: FUN14 domain-containing protein [Nitrososphaeraceae archaeon]
MCSLGGIGGAAGFLIGYAINKVMKILLIIGGLILVGFIYFGYHRVLNIDWNKIRLSVEDGLSGIVNMTSGKIPAEFPSGGDQLISAALTNYGIPITGSIAAGFVIGFIKG